MRGAFLMAALLLAPFVAAHGGAGEAFDPLVLPWSLFLVANGTLDAAPSAPAAVAFPAADPSAPSIPLSFRTSAPLTLRTGPVLLDLHLRATKPVLTRDGEGNSIEVSLFANDEAIFTTKVALPVPALAPDATATVRVEMSEVDALVAEGGPLVLHVRALPPAMAAESLELVLGAGKSTLLFPGMHAPTVADLRLQDAPFHEFLLGDAYSPPADGVAHVVSVLHDTVVFPRIDETQGREVLLVFQGDEAAAIAHASHEAVDRDARLAAAHAFRVGTQVVRVHPGIGVVVPAGTGPKAVVVECVKNCPSTFQGTVLFGTPAESTPPIVITDDPSVLIPPPRSTVGLPVSEDAPDEKGVPGLPVAWVIGSVLVVALLPRKKGGPGGRLPPWIKD